MTTLHSSTLVFTLQVGDDEAAVRGCCVCVEVSAVVSLSSVGGVTVEWGQV